MSDPHSRQQWLASLSAPGSLESEHVAHSNMLAADPHFYGQLAAWYFDNGDASVHRQAFAACLVLARPPLREVGLALVHRLSVCELAAALDFIHGRKRATSAKERPLPRASGLVARLGRLVGRPSIALPAPRVETNCTGLFRCTPRSLRTEIARYLRCRETDTARFDADVLASRRSLKRLYALNHIKPGPRAQQILFDRNPPPGSLPHSRRMLSRMHATPEQVRAIADLAIPYRAAIPAIRQMTPTLLLAFVEQMSPADVLENLASLNRRGAMSNAYLKGRIDRKIKDMPPPIAPVAQKCCADPVAEIMAYPLPRRCNAAAARR